MLRPWHDPSIFGKIFVGKYSVTTLYEMKLISHTCVSQIENSAAGLVQTSVKLPYFHHNFSNS